MHNIKCAGGHSLEMHCRTLMVSTVQISTENLAGGLLRHTLSSFVGEQSSDAQCQICWWAQLRCALSNFVYEHSSDVRSQNMMVSTIQVSTVNFVGEHSSDPQCQSLMVSKAHVSSVKLCWWTQLRHPLSDLTGGHSSQM